MYFSSLGSESQTIMLKFFMNPYTFAGNILNASEELLTKATENTDSISKEELVLMLIFLEVCLDKSRAIAPAGSATEFPETKKYVEQKLDELRKQIAELIKKADMAKFNDIKRQTIEELGRNFTHNLSDS